MVTVLDKIINIKNVPSGTCVRIPGQDGACQCDGLMTEAVIQRKTGSPGPGHGDAHL